jgi:hypothetical protein
MMRIPAMNRLIALTLLCLSSAFAGYKTAPGGALPEEGKAHAPAVAGQGIKVLKDNGSVLMEVWFVKAIPGGGAPEDNTALPEVPNGALLGVVHFPERHSDRRGQTIKPGVYTLRYSRYPVNGDHMGVAPQRDFALLSVAAKDQDPAARPGYERLVSMSRVASGTPHPLVLSIWKEDTAPPAPIEELGEEETVLHVQIGGIHFAMIIAGVHVG